jgi:hypothetical protein
MTREEAEKHPLWPSFKEWIDVRIMPTGDFWWHFWYCYLAGADAEKQRILDRSPYGDE